MKQKVGIDRTPARALRHYDRPRVMFEVYVVGIDRTPARALRLIRSPGSIRIPLAVGIDRTPARALRQPDVGALAFHQP